LDREGPGYRLAFRTQDIELPTAQAYVGTRVEL